MIETFEKLIEQNDFIRNIRRMFIMKVIEKYDIEKVSTVKPQFKGTRGFF